MVAGRSGAYEFQLKKETCKLRATFVLRRDGIDESLINLKKISKIKKDHLCAFGPRSNYAEW